MNQVMTESGEHVVVIAATNDITLLDPSVLCPGRLDRRVYIAPPVLTARQSILRQRLAAMPLRYRVDGDSPAYLRETARTNESGCSHDHWKVEMPSMRQNVAQLDSIEGYVEWLAGETDGASYAQITALCREASMVALREGIGATEESRRHFELFLCPTAAQVTCCSSGKDQKCIEAPLATGRGERYQKRSIIVPCRRKVYEETTERQLWSSEGVGTGGSSNPRTMTIVT